MRLNNPISTKAKVHLYPGETVESVPIVGIHWYNGAEGLADLSYPTVAICFQNGICQLMRGEYDDSSLHS